MTDDEPELEICSHCGQPMEWQDMFGFMWCTEMYFGHDQKEKKDD